MKHHQSTTGWLLQLKKKRNSSARAQSIINMPRPASLTPKTASSPRCLEAADLSHTSSLPPQAVAAVSRPSSPPWLSPCTG
ncbi:hypothetical protein M0R45_008833 [Rubus argutus]|uniref:Uncharacterized protein n=1 Tax=Rubus argutus TaxID=59490 RepID=A0AAW1Y657_RUBAR